MSRTIFITGGATGIGRATVRTFINRGWNVAFLDIDRSGGELLVREVGAPTRLLFAEGDTRSRADLERAVVEAEQKFGGLDAVFANAGIHRSNTLLNISDDELHRMVDINIYGTIHTLQAAVPALIRRGGGSVVINCSDQWFVGKPHSFAYGLTKGALGQITRSLSIDLGPQGVRVNAVCAGTIHTPLMEEALRRASVSGSATYEELLAEENALYARGCVGQPQEVANMVYFLASDESSFCTGGHYLIDGGLVAQ